MKIKIRIDGEIRDDFTAEVTATDTNTIIIDLLDVLPLRPDIIKCRVRVQGA